MATISPERMQKRPTERGKLHFMLAWFHAVTVDRLRFSPLGWSNYYEFSSADMRCAFDCFDAWMDAKGGGKHNIDPENIPWTALVTSLGQVFYGGRVDNLFDQRVMMSFLQQIFKPEAFQHQIYDLSPTLGQTFNKLMPQFSCLCSLVVIFVYPFSLQYPLLTCINEFLTQVSHYTGGVLNKTLHLHFIYDNSLLPYVCMSVYFRM